MRRLIASFLLASSLLATPFAVGAQTQPPSAEQTAFIAELKAMQTRLQAKSAWFNDESDPSGGQSSLALGGQTYTWKKGVAAQFRHWLNFFKSVTDTTMQDVSTSRSPGPDPDFNGQAFTYGKVIELWVDRCSQWSQPIDSFGGYLGETIPKLDALRMSSDQITQLKTHFNKMEQNVDGLLNVDSPVIGFHPCELAARDIMTFLYRTQQLSPTDKWACVYNYFLSYTQNVDPDGDGRCQIRAAAWKWPFPAPTSSGGSLYADQLNAQLSLDQMWRRACLMMGTSGCDTSSCPRHISDKETSLPRCEGDLIHLYRLGVEKANAGKKQEIAKVLDAVTADNATAAKSTAQIGADLQARGTALSLPLPLSDISVEGVIGRVLNALLGIVGAIALLMFVWGGFTWMTAAGNQEQIGKAQKTLTWAAIGLIAIFSAYAVLQLVINAFTK